MSIINLLVIITDVGMWVTPKRLTDEVYYKHLWNYPHLNIRQINAFRSVVILVMMMKSKTVEVDLYHLQDAKISSEPFEGHFNVTAKAQSKKHQETFYPGSVRIPTGQVLGDLVVYLLEPESPDSFLAWGFFSGDL